MADEKEKGPSKVVGLRIPHEVADALEREADGVPLATYITVLLKRYVRDGSVERKGP